MPRAKKKAPLALEKLELAAAPPDPQKTAANPARRAAGECSVTRTALSGPQRVRP